MSISLTFVRFVQEIARFLGVFGINTASDISKFTKISRAAAAASDIWGVLKYHEPVFIPNTPKKPCYLPGPSRRLAPVIKCRRFLSFFHRYIVRDISLT